MAFVIKKQGSNMVIDSIGGGLMEHLDGLLSVGYIGGDGTLGWVKTFETRELAQEIANELMNDMGQGPLEVKEIIEVNGVRKYVEEV